MSTAIEASVVIPTRNRSRILSHTLSRLLRQSLARDAYDIVVVDDGSTDDTRAVVEAVGSPVVTYIGLPRGSRARSRNEGVRAARGRILVFLDDDAFVGADFVERHLRAHAGVHPVTVTGPIVRIGVVPDDLPHRGRLEGWHLNPLPTCNGSVPAEAAERAGLFDEGFTLYGWEDVDLGYRLAAAGVGRRFRWDVPIFHYKPPATQFSMPHRTAIERKRGAMGARLFRKHPRLDVAIITKVWPPIRALDAAICRVYGLEALAERASRDPDLRLGPLRRWLVCKHVEGTSARRQLLGLSGAARRS